MFPTIITPPCIVEYSSSQDFSECLGCCSLGVVTDPGLDRHVASHSQIELSMQSHLDPTFHQLIPLHAHFCYCYRAWLLVACGGLLGGSC